MTATTFTGFQPALSAEPSPASAAIAPGGGLSVVTSSGLPTDLTATEETATPLDLSGLSLSSSNSGASVSLTLTATSGRMTASSYNGVTVTGSGENILILTGTAAAIESWLNSNRVVYTGAADVAGDNAAAITVTADDGSGAVTLGTVNLDLTDTTEAPILTGLPGTLTFAENAVNAAPQLLNIDVSVSDFENDFDGGALQIVGLLTQDAVSVRNQGTAAGQIGLSAPISRGAA